MTDGPKTSTELGQKPPGVWLPILWAALLTVLNCGKPATVDDTAYLLAAEQIRVQPLDPYGYELFWYKAPQPAMEILMPPVVPYWMALGSRLTGLALPLWKLSLFPFALVLAFSLRYLLSRWAPSTAGYLLPAILLGPAVLPMLGVMLDVAALALGLASLCLTLSALDSPYRWQRLVVAGIVLGLAVQTKYSMLTMPAVIGVYGLLHRRIVETCLVVTIGVITFAAWEAYLVSRYGESHFVYHLKSQGQDERKPPASDGFRSTLKEKSRLFQPMLGHLGWLGLFPGWLALAGLGVPRRWLALLISVGLLGILVAVWVPPERAWVVPGKLSLIKLVFVTWGAASALAVLAASVRLLLIRAEPDERRTDRFLVAWLLIELAGYFVLTPFAAARRVISLAVVATLVAARLAQHRQTIVGLDKLALAAVILGLGLFAVDTWDAMPETVLARQAAKQLRAELSPKTVWYTGHWGFQFACEREGMKPIVPGVSQLSPGDTLVLPVMPDDVGFYRPYHGEAKFRFEPDRLAWLGELVWDDKLPCETIPPLYGGDTPIRTRHHPRLQLALYRVLLPWTPQPES